jgi:hypothetical protein
MGVLGDNLASKMVPLRRVMVQGCRWALLASLAPWTSLGCPGSLSPWSPETCQVTRVTTSQLAEGLAGATWAGWVWTACISLHLLTLWVLKSGMGGASTEKASHSYSTGNDKQHDVMASTVSAYTCKCNHIPQTKSRASHHRKHAQPLPDSRSFAGLSGPVPLSVLPRTVFAYSSLHFRVHIICFWFDGSVL